MSTKEIQLDSNAEAVNRGFTRQSAHYDESDRSNIILQDLRAQVYRYTENFLRPNSRILELNAGTGIDAAYFAARGHTVHATDVSDGMIREIRRKMASESMQGRLTCQQLSYEQLDYVQERNFDLVFSNFGGLNCAKNLENVAKHLTSLLNVNGHVVWVVMPVICPWELMSTLTGKSSTGLRRLNKNGVCAHLEGEYFQTYYHSVAAIRSALGPRFEFVNSQSLAVLSPPPHATKIVEKYPRLYHWLRKLDGVMRDRYPFSRWGDHVIVTFRFQG